MHTTFKYVLYGILGIGIVLFVLFAARGVSLERNAPEPGKSSSSTEVVEEDTLIGSVAIGATKRIQGVDITLHEIVADYRCPSDDVECPEAGGVVARVTLRSDNATETFNMPSDEAPRIFAGHKVSIEGVNPPLISLVTPDPAGYVVTFRVEGGAI